MVDVTKSAYAEKMNKVCDYIYAHIDENLSVEQLSKVANFSKYHFHRQFSEYMGIGVSKFIQLIRLKRASYQLVFDKKRRVIDIAYDANFESPESFSRAFKNLFEQTPTEFRNKPKWGVWCDKYYSLKMKVEHIMDVKIVEFPQTKVAVLEHRGSPELIINSVDTFISWRKESKLSPIATSKSLGLGYDDPITTAPDNFRFDICGSVETEVPENVQGVINKVIPGGRCAMVRHHGSHETLDTKVHYLYGEWLSTSGEELRDFPCFFDYIKLAPEVQEDEQITDIYLPLK